MSNLKQTTDKFSLFADGRTVGANKRNYVLQAVKKMFSEPSLKEKIKLGECFGYYGHQLRQRANKLDLGETEVINVAGKPVVVSNVPSNRTLSINVDDNGIVTHTQEILNTKTGQLVESMIDFDNFSNSAGGWSWATSGSDTPSRSITRSYHGMDYVLQPNFISLNKQSAMLESVSSADQESMMLESMVAGGVDHDSALQALAYLKRNDNNLAVEIERENMILESMIAELQLAKHQNDTKNQLMTEALSAMPIFMTDEQRKSLQSMSSDHDVMVVKKMFESLNGSKMSTLPLNGQSNGLFVEQAFNINSDECIDLRTNTTRKFS